MKISIWFDNVDDDDFESVIFEEPIIVATIIVPAIGEKVGIWQTEIMKNADSDYRLFHRVVDITHFIDRERQEIHVLCSNKGAY